MKRYLLILVFIVSNHTLAFSGEAPKDMTRFNITCPSEELCPLLDQSSESCKNTNKTEVCSIYIQIFRKLVQNYDCHRSFDNTPNKKYIVPAYWLCDPTKAWAQIEFLSKLKMYEAQEFFASSEFRSILDGELAEGFMEMSFGREKKQKLEKQ